MTSTTKQYEIKFTGRLLGAIGIFYGFTVRVKAENEEKALLELYKTHEHITQAKIKEIA